MLGPESGDVSVKQAGTDEYASLEAGTPVPVGSIVDATAGTVRLIAQTSNASTQDVVLRGAKFEVRQAKDGSGVTEFVLKGEDFGTCRQGADRRVQEAQAAPLALGERPRRQVPHPRAATASRPSAGTTWRVTDTCAGTTTTVYSGSVVVREARSGRSYVVRKGRHHLAARSPVSRALSSPACPESPPA